MVAGTHWESWNVSPAAEGGFLDTKNHLIVQAKWMNCMACEIPLNKFVKKRQGDSWVSPHRSGWSSRSN